MKILKTYCGEKPWKDYECTTCYHRNIYPLTSEQIALLDEEYVDQRIKDEKDRKKFYQEQKYA